MKLKYCLLIVVAAGQVSSCTVFDCGRSKTQSATGMSTRQTEEKPKYNILEILEETGQHKTLLSTIKAAELSDVLGASGPYTLFAPTDKAFSQLPEGKLDEWLKPENKVALQNILQFHIAMGIFKDANFADGQVFGMANGQSTTVSIKDGLISLDEAAIRQSIPASNGMVHFVDHVLVPPPRDQ